MNEKGFIKLKYMVVIAALAVVLVVAVVWVSVHIYDYTEHDPSFCMTCHIMEEAFQSWETSIHKSVECHACHYATVLEKNQMLLKTMIEYPDMVTERPHGKVLVPSTMCIRCHWEGDVKVAKVSNSTGHALHWFKGSIECTDCHAVKLHQFEAEQKFCEDCHASGKKMLAGMQDMKCTACHDFRTGRLMPKGKMCVQCHEDHTSPVQVAGRSQAHRLFDCVTCHKVHRPERPPRMACKKCHVLTQNRGRHPLHLDVVDGDCTACHAPHRWQITKKDSKSLCSQCHDFHPLESFN